ncbi:MAG: TIGR01777 family oxidoreductase [Acidobacteriota bacterium]
MTPATPTDAHRSPRVAVSGASGLVGSALCEELEQNGYEVLRLVRREAGAGEIAWQPLDGLPEPAQAEGLDAIVHLAGESLASGRWTDARKERFRSSRVDATAALVRSLQELDAPPQSFLCASGVGFYGDRGEKLVDETSEAGRGFLADLCVEWERAAREGNPAKRVVHLRFGVVLDKDSGALPKMLTPARLGLGGPMGSGEQAFPWIALDDCVAAIRWLLEHADLEGPFNVVAPPRDTSSSFARSLGRALGRPALLPAPAFALRLALGEMADEMLLSGQQAVPRALEESGFSFRFADTLAALRHVLGKA